MEYSDIKRSYSHLSTEELRDEIALRSEHRYRTRNVGASGCMIDAWVLTACSELLRERGETA